MENKNITIIEIRLKFLRDLKNIRQVDIANYLNISRALINSWENGYANIPLKHLVKLSYFYKVPIDYILGLTTKFDKSIYNYKEDADLKYLGKMIKLIRKIENLKQEEFARIVHVERSSLSHYENGYTAMSCTVLKEICDTFGFSADWCLGNTSKYIRRDKKVKIKQHEIREFIEI